MGEMEEAEVGGNPGMGPIWCLPPMDEGSSSGDEKRSPSEGSPR